LQLVWLPETTSQDGSLTHLNQKGCAARAALPHVIGACSECTRLDLWVCVSPAGLPNGTGDSRHLA